MELEKQKRKKIIKKRKRKLTKRTNQRGLWLSLPHCIVAAIFSKLPISNLPACRLVCKSWNRLILEYATTFTRKAMIYITRDHNPGNSETCFLNPKIHCFDIDTLSFVASCTLIGPFTEFISLYDSCNGLLFLENGGVEIGRESPGIFNPMTHEFFPIPSHKDIYIGFFGGFGFSPKTKEYKLFLVPDGDPEPESEYYMKILRFGRNPNQWVNVSLPFTLSITSHGVCMDGVIYFLGRDDNKCVMTIYALDVEIESFEVVAVLEVGARPNRAFLELFNGTIYAQFFIYESSQVQIWRMQVKDSWVKEFTISGDVVHKSFELLKASGDRKIFVRIDENLFWLNKSTRTIRLKKKNKIKTLNIPSYQGRFFNVSSCLIETLHFGSLSSILAGDEQLMNS